MISDIKNKKVGIAGLGGLGSNIAISLVRIGIKNLVICDFDKVELSNLNRQAYFSKHIGEYKTIALKEILNDIYNDLNLEIHTTKLNKNNYIHIFKDCDVIAEALDLPKEKSQLCNSILSLTKIPIVAASGIAGCDSGNKIKTKKINNNFFICGDFKSSCNSFEELLAPRVLICANHQALMIAKILSNNTNS